MIRAFIRNGRVSRCDLPVVSETPPRTFRLLASRMEASSARDRAALKQADKFIRGTFDGKVVDSPELEMPGGTTLQTRVWSYLAGMKTGEYVTYGKLAKLIGRSRAARAVGQACGANPIPLFIPCHRVLGAGSSEGGFSCGLAWKHLLIKADTGKTMSELKKSSVSMPRGATKVSRRVA